jgi:hypothetical protein
MPRSIRESLESQPLSGLVLGIDFRQQIQEAITKNDLVLAVIGPKWIGSKKAGATRISDYQDPIRIEIETALNRGIPLIPVVVGGATMPKGSALPDSLQKLPFLNAAEVDDGRDFHQHVDRLIRAMDRLLTESKLASLGQKSVNRPVTDVTASSSSRDDATPKEQLEEDRSVQDTSDPSKNAEFSSFFCEQTTASARAALLIGLFSLILAGATDLPNEMQEPAMSAYPWVDLHALRVRCFCSDLFKPGTALLADLFVSSQHHKRSANV